MPRSLRNSLYQSECHLGQWNYLTDKWSLLMLCYKLMMRASADLIANQ